MSALFFLAGFLILFSGGNDFEIIISFIGMTIASGLGGIIAVLQDQTNSDRRNSLIIEAIEKQTNKQRNSDRQIERGINDAIERQMNDDGSQRVDRQPMDQPSPDRERQRGDPPEHRRR